MWGARSTMGGAPKLRHVAGVVASASKSLGYLAAKPRHGANLRGKRHQGAASARQACGSIVEPDHVDAAQCPYAPATIARLSARCHSFRKTPHFSARKPPRQSRGRLVARQSPPPLPADRPPEPANPPWPAQSRRPRDRPHEASEVAQIISSRGAGQYCDPPRHGRRVCCPIAATDDPSADFAHRPPF